MNNHDPTMTQNSTRAAFGDTSWPFVRLSPRKELVFSHHGASPGLGQLGQLGSMAPPAPCHCGSCRVLAAAQAGRRPKPRDTRGQNGTCDVFLSNARRRLAASTRKKGYTRYTSTSKMEVDGLDDPAEQGLPRLHVHCLHCSCNFSVVSGPSSRRSQLCRFAL